MKNFILFFILFSLLYNIEIFSGSEPLELTKYADKQIVMTSDGQILMSVWQETENPAENIFYTKIEFTRSNDYGQTWSSHIFLSPIVQTSAIFEAPKIVMSTDGQRAIVIWKVICCDTKNYVVQAIRTDDYGVKWKDLTIISTENYISDHKIVMSDDGRRALIYWDRKGLDNNNIESIRTDDYGATWKDLKDATAIVAESLPSEILN